MPTLVTKNGGQMSSLNFMRIVKKAISDGIVDGCSVTKSGAVINVTEGHIIACGALVEVEATSFTVSANGELILRIDLTSETPAQLITRAPTTLTQQDLTIGGTVYEFRLAKYTFSSGSVTGISNAEDSTPSSSGQNSGNSTSSKNGTVVSKISSTASSPAVNYSSTYESTKNGTALNVKLSFSAWLNSSGSSLGTGIKLTVFARLNSGEWSSSVIKESNASWSGTSHHSTSISLSASSSGSTATVEFYVTRSGSSYSGSAGTLGSASSPKTYTINI